MADESAIRNCVAELRRRRGIPAAQLAQQVGLSRPAMYAIEAGTYVPNTEVALKLARALDVVVTDLFSLADAPAVSRLPHAADVVSAQPPVRGQAVRVSKVGSRWVTVPVPATQYYLPDADGLVRRASRARLRADLTVVSGDMVPRSRLVLGGCDPATEILARTVERSTGVEVLPAAGSSRLALEWLKEGRIHIAGTHLEDESTGEFNLPYLQEHFAAGDYQVITFARWEEGLVVAPANPKRIRDASDLVRSDVRIVNREPGAGSRALLERLLHDAGIDARRVRGYQSVALGHLAAAQAVAHGTADVCVATGSAARGLGLGFVPLRTERYDFVMRKAMADLPEVRAFCDVLQRASVRRKIAVLAGYDTRETGAQLA